MAKIESYQLSKQAAQDLEDVFDYTAHEFGLAQAVQYLNELEGVFLQMIDNPGLGKTRDEIKSGLRSFPKSSHIIFYRILKGHIRIVRVLHGSRDIPKFL
jgi:toxin ParE1/3/4